MAPVSADPKTRSLQSPDALSAGCPQCGGRVILREETIFHECPHCNSALYAEAHTLYPRVVFAATVASWRDAVARIEQWAYVEYGRRGAQAIREEIQEQLSDIEDTLEEARDYVGWFITGYWILIVVIAVLILAIIAIHHRVKGASLHLGIMFLVLGTIECIAVFVGRGIASSIIAEQDIPAAVQHLPDKLITDVTSPLAALSIGLIVLGVILIAASIVYPRLRRAEIS